MEINKEDVPNIVLINKKNRVIDRDLIPSIEDGELILRFRDHGKLQA